MRLRWAASEWRIVIALALAKLLFHLVTFHGYGIFRDELYYLACSRHLAWGYVEFPPLIAVLTRAVTMVLGESLFAIRLLPAVPGAGLVALTAMIARELGGGRFAQALASLAVMVAPAWMSIDHILNTNAFEPLFWPGSVWLAIRAWNTGDSRYWLGFGAVAGLGLQNKQAMLFFGFGIAAGLLLTPLRKSFAQRNLWLGGVIAALIFLPNIVWEIRLGWPTLEFLENAVKYCQI
jgi:4-amino-4-deoxy-L-arabinose transferase-like glycosyltransferase